MSPGLDLDVARAFVLDVDGCLVLSDGPGGTMGGHALPGAPELVMALKERGISVLCCTNGSASPASVYVQNLREKGIDVIDGEMLTPALAGARHIVRHHEGASVLPIGGEGLTSALAERDIRLTSADDEEGPDVVIVGHTHVVTREELQRAALAVLDGAVFFVTATAPWFAARGGKGLGMAAAVAGAIATVTGQAPTVVGKPSTILMEAASELLGVQFSEMVVVGDDIVAEVGMGREHGAQTVLVLSGVTSRERASAAPPERRADLTVDDVAGLLAQLDGRLGDS
jgi:5'-nucleotidase